MGKRGKAKEAGFSLLEISFTTAILAGVVLAFSLQIAKGIQTVENDRETTLAMNAAREMIERIRDYGPFSDTFAAYNSVSADDPAAPPPPAPTPAPSFSVDGLEAQDNDPDGLVGLVRFPEDPNNPGTLSEGIADAALGCPCDLNRDGDVADNFVAGPNPGYLVLPVAVRIEWRSGSGRNRFLEVQSMVAPK